jgi:hypothetical protein
LVILKREQSNLWFGYSFCWKLLKDTQKNILNGYCVLVICFVECFQRKIL